MTCVHSTCFLNLKQRKCFLMQLKKQFPTLNLKIPAKRIFGDNFDPGTFDEENCYHSNRESIVLMK